MCVSLCIYSEMRKPRASKRVSRCSRSWFLKLDLPSKHKVLASTCACVRVEEVCIEGIGGLRFN